MAKQKEKHLETLQELIEERLHPNIYKMMHELINSKSREETYAVAFKYLLAMWTEGVRYNITPAQWAAHEKSASKRLHKFKGKKHDRQRLNQIKTIYDTVNKTSNKLSVRAIVNNQYGNQLDKNEIANLCSAYTRFMKGKDDATIKLIITTGVA